MKLPPRKIGPFSVSAVSLGCMNLSHAYGPPLPDKEAEDFLNAALDHGVTMLDTAAIYGNGNNERLIGRAVMHRRSEFTLASKCVLSVVGDKRILDASPQAIEATLDSALRRLGTEHIDLYYLHRLDPKVPIEESVGALARAREAGKIGAIGLSEMSAATIRRAHAVHPIAAVQSEYSPIVRNVEIAVLDACRALGITLVAFSPVARGLLAGGVRDDQYSAGDIRLGMPRFIEPQLSHNLTVFRAFADLAREIDCTPAQLSLAWVLSRGDNIVALPGTQKLSHLIENLGAATLSLPAETHARIEAIFPAGAIRGARYSAPMQATIDTETFADEELA